MVARITREVIEPFLKCRYKGHLKLTGEQGSPCDYEVLSGERRERLRLTATAKLLARHSECEVLRLLAVSREVLRRGVPLILEATVESEGFSVRFDALQRAAGPSALGDFHYVPVLYHETERPGREQRALLAVLGLILERVQGKRPEWGLLFHGQGCELRRVKLGAEAQSARRTLQGLKEIQGAGTPPRLLLNPHCQVCEFRQRCHAEATAKDDLSLLRGMGEKEIAKHARRGIFSVTQLSCTFRPPKRGKRSTPGRQPHLHALQALALREGKVYILGSPELPSASTRIYFDIEGDPERRFDYLLGMIVEANGAIERHSFWADTPAEEPQLFQRLLDVVARFEGCQLYCYGGYEAAFLRRISKVLEPQGLAESLLSRLVNVLTVVHAHVYFPTWSNGLKDIGRFLGCRWTAADASGIQSVVWRHRWEETRSVGFKDMLTTYNLEDCAALRKVTEFLYAVCPGPPPGGIPTSMNHEGHAVARVTEVGPEFKRREWCHATFAVPDFEFVNQRAYFDYQRDRVFVRASKPLQRNCTRLARGKRKKKLRANRRVEIDSQACPACGGGELTRSQDGRLTRFMLDLRISRGIRRRVTRFSTTRHHCVACGKEFLPADYLRLEEHGHALKSWAMYEHVAHRASIYSIAETIQDCFGLPVTASDVCDCQLKLARYYEGTYQQLLERIVAGGLIHADETEVHLKGKGKGYVWVFTSMEEVVFLYRKSREGGFLPDLLKGFRGVLVSDFYAVYDSLECAQQKCLIHLMRDFNHDVQASPWDEELKALASRFGELLRRIVATIDLYGLRKRHLGKHGRDVDGFFRVLAEQEYRSELAEGYRARLLKNREKLFTFLHYDGVPWNNNNAEHAIKKFADYRQLADGQFSEAGLRQYLLLLSLCLTCRYKRVGLLKFLLSRETDIDLFCRTSSKRRPPPAMELYPEGSPSLRSSRRKLQTTDSAQHPDKGPEAARIR
jgi:predicted RecB family nuclease